MFCGAGMWALFKWKKYKALKELVLEDALGGKLNKTFLFKLSQNEALAKFHKVILVSSPFDQYVPYYSARVQVSVLLIHCDQAYLDEIH